MVQKCPLIIVEVESLRIHPFSCSNTQNKAAALEAHTTTLRMNSCQYKLAVGLEHSALLKRKRSLTKKLYQLAMLDLVLHCRMFPFWQLALLELSSVGRQVSELLQQPLIKIPKDREHIFRMFLCITQTIVYITFSFHTSNGKFGQDLSQLTMHKNLLLTWEIFKWRKYSTQSTQKSSTWLEY